jgi:hypothetical protein
MAYTNVELVREIFRKFAVSFPAEALPERQDDWKNIRVGDYLLCWNNMKYEVHCKGQWLKSGDFCDMVKYAVAHWNREQMNIEINLLAAEAAESYFNEPDPSSEAEDRALSQAYSRIYNT